MSLSCRAAAELRRWQPAAGFDVGAHAPFFYSEAWGQRLAAGTDGLPVNVRAHLTVAPEGLALHARCERCGARHEAVLDFRSLEESCFGIRAQPADFDGFGLERAQYVEFVLLQHPLRAWADGHLRCLPAPELASAPELPPRLAEVVHLVQALAANDLREEGMAEATVVIVPDDGPPLWLDRDGFDDAARALTAFRVREITDRGTPSGYALVSSEEAPGPGRAFAWQMAVLTAETYWSALASVTRPGGLARGPGVLHPPQWSVLRADADWLDGLRAQRSFFPITRPSREEA